MADNPLGYGPHNWVVRPGASSVYTEGEQQYITRQTNPTWQYPVYEWKLVQYRWIGHNSVWRLAFDYQRDSKQSQDVTLDNAKYFEGAAYRGDMAFFGKGLNELSNGESGYGGSVYPFYANGADYSPTENYPSFNVNGTAEDIFRLDGIHRYARLRATENQAYFDSISAAPNICWSFGSFTSYSGNQLANSFHMKFRIPDDAEKPTNEVDWLYYSVGSIGYYKSFQWEGAFGACLTSDNGRAIVFYRESFSGGTGAKHDFYRVPLAFFYNDTGKVEPAYDKWFTLSVYNTAQGFTTWKVNEGYSSEVSHQSSMPDKLKGDYTPIYIGKGPSCTPSQVSGGIPVGTAFVVDNLANMDVRRVYIETANIFSSTVPLYWKVPVLETWFTPRYGGGEPIDATEYLVNWPHEQDNRVFTMQMPSIPNGVYDMSCISNFGTSNTLPLRIDNVKVIREEFFDDFNDMLFTKDNFLLAHKQWGGTGQIGPDVQLKNGGVSAENVNMYPYYTDLENEVDGVIRCSGNGIFYDGPILGVDRHGNPSPDGRKTEVGACIATRDYTGPGSYRMRVRSPDTGGAALAYWTFHYEEIYPNDARWDQFQSEGLSPTSDGQGGEYIVRNHEIDIEYPTALKSQEPYDMENVSHENARLNTWIGEQDGEYADDFNQWAIGNELNDGEWHVIGFNWHVDGVNDRVEFYIDDVLKYTATDFIPDIPGRMWLGIWYPRAPGNRWGGPYAAYVTEHLDIDWFRFTPFPDEPGRTIGETYPNDVWHPWAFDSFHQEPLTELPPNLYPPGPDPESGVEFGDYMPEVLDTTIYAGNNPPAYVRSNRLEWRSDIRRPNNNKKGNFFIIKPEWGGQEVTLIIDIIWLAGDLNNTLYVEDYVAPADYIPIPNEIGRHAFVGVLANNGKVLISNQPAGEDSLKVDLIHDVVLLLGDHS